MLRVGKDEGLRFKKGEFIQSKISGVFIAYYFNGNIIRVRNIS